MNFIVSSKLKRGRQTPAPSFYCARDSVLNDRLPDHRIDPLAQLLARLEVRHPFFRDHHFVAGLRIASNAWRPRIQGKAAKTTDLDALAVGQGVGHRIEDG